MGKPYVLVGAGGRGRGMFALPMVKELKAFATLVGICDANSQRARLLSEECGGIHWFNDFDEMIHTCKPETVIVTTIDSSHHEFIIRGLEAGCDVISEKPMTIDADKCRAIMEAERRSGRKVAVTFNARYLPYVVKVKELLKEKVIGDIHHVQLEWFLDRKHGADYFRRWHRRLDQSGGLLIHKASHHFDMVNWWLDDEPVMVHAFGDLRFFGRHREIRGQRCLTCGHRESCSFYYDISSQPFTKSYYLEAEQADGYIRDQCVFGDDIDIFDTMSVHVKYGTGALLTYSLTSYNPMEGWKASFVGTEGRLEAEYVFSGPGCSPDARTVKVYGTNGDLQSVEVPEESGGHGGSDERLRRMLFVGGTPDVLNQRADSRAGAMSVLIGAAANRSILQGTPVAIDDMLQPVPGSEGS